MNTAFHILGFYLFSITTVTFFTYGRDKHLAKSKRCNRRISEKSLLLLAIAGGSIGAWIAMYTFRHKTQHKKFKYGIPTILLAQCLIIYKTLQT
ncbi:MAG: DUF1294 domain-containing protein [Paludibacteraceae bacterium]